MPWYREGTVAIVAGQTTVTGTGTNFAANSRVGDALQGPDGRWYEVANITSGTVLSILPAYQGATVTGGSYGLAPMQGYVKESADRLRQTVEQFGATLALLGTASSAAQLRENIGAAARGANNDITSLAGLTTPLSVAQGGTGGQPITVANGGTGGNTAATARAGLGLKAAAVADVLGTVSQSGGVPTGAIFEKGSNANGEYVKFADGSMYCTAIGQVEQFAAQGSLFISNQTSTLLPVSFISTDSMRAFGGDGLGPNVWVTAYASAPDRVQARSYFTGNITVFPRAQLLGVWGRWR